MRPLLRRKKDEGATIFSKIIEPTKEFFQNTEPRVLRLVKYMIILGILTGLLEYSFVYVLQLFVFTMGLVPKSNVNVPDFLPTDAIFVVTLLIAFGFLRSFFAGMKIYLSRTASQVFYAERRKVVIDLALHNHGVSSGKTISIFSDEINRAGMAVLRMAHIIITLITALVLLGSGFYLAPKETIVGIVCLAGLFLLSKLFQGKTGDTGKDLSDEWEATSQSLMSGIKNNFYLKVYGLVEQEVTKAHAALEKYFNHYKSFIKANAFRQAFPGFLGVVLVGFLTFFSRSQFNTPPGVLLSFLYLFMRFAQTIGDFAGVYHEYKVFYSSFKNLNEWTKEMKKSSASWQTTKLQKSENTVKPDQISELSASDVSFNYEDRPILQKINFKAKKGEFITIKGESGSGKSTLLSIVLGLLSPSNGSVKFNNEDILQNRECFIEQTSYIGPEPYIVEGTIKDNLLYGHPAPEEISNEDIDQILKTTCLNDLISSLEQGIHTKLDEIGTRLSTGQKQRISIARGLLRNASLLVMDEAFSNLDAETEDQIIKNMEGLNSERIVLAVTHKKIFDRLASQSIQLSNNKEERPAT